MAATDQAAFWAAMRGVTRARIGLGRAGDAMPTAALLDLQLAFARARDAVHGAADFDLLAQGLAPRRCLQVRSEASDRATYLQRPDLGRRLTAESRSSLESAAGGRDWDIVFVTADGLSAAALMQHAPEVLAGCFSGLADWKIAPVVLAENARVALGEDIAESLGARCVAILIGERPGLSAPDSLGIYISWAPSTGMPDSRRNCISNIHGTGLAPRVAADRAVWLIREATRLRLSGTGLKEAAPDRPSLPDPVRELPAA